MLILSLFLMLFLFFLVGIVAERLLKFSFSLSNALMLGFISTLAVFHVIAYPMLRLNASFTALFYTYSIILVSIIFCAFKIIASKETRMLYQNHTKALLFDIRTEFLLFLLTLGVILYVLLISCGYAYETSDDSYYLPRVMEILSQNRLGISHTFGWSGINEGSFPESADASTMECWKAYWSYLFGLHPTVFCRNSFSIVIHIVSLCTLYQAYKNVSKHHDSRLAPCLFLIVYLVMVLRDNRFSSTLPYWTIRYPAQGKSILCSVIYPALIYGCSAIVSCEKKVIPWQKWALLALIFTAGIATTIIGVFWPFLCCLCMGIPYLLIERHKDLHKLLIPLILACLPVVIYAGLTLFTVTTEQPRYFAYATPNWLESMTIGLNADRIDLFIICLIFTLIMGSKNARFVVAGGFLVLTISFLNPLFIGFVSKYLTTGSVYFRLFWMVPLYFLIAYTAAELFGGCKLKNRNLAVLTLSFVMMISCICGIVKLGPKGFYQTINLELRLHAGGERRNNLWGIPSLWYETGSLLLEDVPDHEDVSILWFSTADCHLRQYSERIQLIGGCRTNQRKNFDLPLTSGTQSPYEFWEEFSDNDRYDFNDPTEIMNYLKDNHIEYFAVDSESGFYKRTDIPEDFSEIWNDEGIIIYRIIQ